MKIIKVDDSNFASINLEVENEYKYLYLGNVYDFQGRSVENLRINTPSVTIKNLKITGQLSILNETTHCKFENVVFERPSLENPSTSDQSDSNSSDNTISYNTPLVSFGYGTVATIFEDCVFIGDDTYNYVMKASVKREFYITSDNGLSYYPEKDRSINDTLVMKNCTYKNLDCVIKATKKFNCVIEGGWLENVKSIIHNNGEFTDHNIDSLNINESSPNDLIKDKSTQNMQAGINSNIIINGIVINNVDYIFHSRIDENNASNLKKQFELKTTPVLYDFDNIVINGVLGEVNSAIVDYSGGYVNLEYNAPVTNTDKLFSADSLYSYYCNVKESNRCSVKVVPKYFNHKLKITVPANETVYPFNDVIVISNVVCENPNLNLNTLVEKIDNSTVHQVIRNEIINILDKDKQPYYRGRLKLVNNSDAPQEIEFKCDSYNLI